MKTQTRSRRPALAAFFLPTIAFLLSSCASPQFSSAWRAANRAQAGDRAPSGIEGAWKGTWKSEATGHTGELKLVVSPASEPGFDNRHDFHYWASWKKIFAGDYHVTYAVREENGKYHVSGEKDLGKLFGGLFTHEGVATPARFDATYKSEKDNGSFTMTRPK